MTTHGTQSQRTARYITTEFVSTIAAIAIGGGLMTILGAGVAGLIASSPHHKDFASRVALVGTGVGVLGVAGLNIASLFEPD
ncbi:MAG: hypothetical protein AAFW75_10835 [Cyanobacteria bacterium J06636_16]